MHLSEDQLKQFQNDGYLAFTDVISADEVREARAAFSRITRELVTDPASEYSPPRKVSKDGYSGASYKRASSESFLQMESGFDPEGKPLEEVELQVRKYMSFCDEDPLFQNMVSPGSRLHGVVESILGEHPILFQEMALVKPPFIGREKPWHQDNAYFSVAPLDAILGVWIALDDADGENGCMHVIPGGHREGAFRHHHGIDCEIDPGLLAVDNTLPVPVPAGGGLFFYGMLPHETPPNRSPLRRRALQFHYRGAHTEILDPEAYNKVFVDRTGQPGSCKAAKPAAST